MSHAWLFTGPEIGQKKQKIEILKQQVKNANNGEIETHTFYAYETDLFEVLQLLQSISLFSAPTFVEFRNAECLKDKVAIDALQKWVKSENQSSYLVLTTDEISVDKKLDGIFPAADKQIFWEMFENKKQEWIRNFFRNNNLSITDDAVDSILDLIENNTDALKNACKNLVLFFEAGTVIQQADIEKLLSHNKDEDVFSLFDALTQANSEKVFEILNKLILVKGFSAVQFLAGLIFCFRRVADIRQAAQVSGQPVNDALLRSFGITGKKAIAQYTRALKLWDYERVLEIIASLNQCDFNVRSFAQPMHSVLIETTLLKIGEAASSRP